jgi:hypothetical protein
MEGLRFLLTRLFHSNDISLYEFCQAFSLYQILEFRLKIGGNDSESGNLPISPMKDFLFAGPAEMNGFLVNFFDVSGRLHHTL